MKIALIGTGHIGLVTAATLASLGHESRRSIPTPRRSTCCGAASNRSSSPAFPELVNEQVAAGRLWFEYESKAVLAPRS
jgi:UDP-glucose 6-dehydrogenase